MHCRRVEISGGLGQRSSSTHVSVEAVVVKVVVVELVSVVSSVDTVLDVSLNSLN